MHLRLEEPLLFFIPDTAKDPRGRTGDEVWVLATIPRQGPPRPIALGIKPAGAGEIQRVEVKLRRFSRAHGTRLQRDCDPPVNWRGIILGPFGTVPLRLT